MKKIFLFDGSIKTGPFSEDEFFDIENIKQVQDAILQLLQYKTLLEKKSYIESLNDTDKHRIVRAYFYIIENNLRSSQKLPH